MNTITKIQSTYLLLQYTFLLLIVFLLEAVIGGLAYVYETHISDELYQTLNGTFMESYGVNERQSAAIDRMQQDVSRSRGPFYCTSLLTVQRITQYTCCGAIRFEDWQRSAWRNLNESVSLRPNHKRLVPDSCCLTISDGCGRRDHPSNIPYTVSQAFCGRCF